MREDWRWFWGAFVRALIAGLLVGAIGLLLNGCERAPTAQDLCVRGGGRVVEIARQVDPWGNNERILWRCEQGDAGPPCPALPSDPSCPLGGQR